MERGVFYLFSDRGHVEGSGRGTRAHQAGSGRVLVKGGNTIVEGDAGLDVALAEECFERGAAICLPVVVR